MGRFAKLVLPVVALRMLERDQDLRVIAECRNGQEAIEVLAKEPIDLVFMDIQMPHANGFETPSWRAAKNW